MATDWAADVKKYAADADDGVIAGIVRYCGIALRNRDSSLVSFSDPTELARVRNNFLKKKLGLTHSDDVLDAAIAKVGEQMKADRTKNRVTVYYLLAEAHGMLDMFVKKTAGKAGDAAAAAALAGTAVAAAKPAAKKASKAAAPAKAAKSAAPKAVPAKADNDEVPAPAASSKIAGAATAAAGGAAMLAAGLGDKASAATAKAADAASGVVDSAKDAAGKAVDSVASAAGAAGDAVSAAVSGGADLAGKAAGAVGDAAGSAVNAVGAGAAAVAGAGAAALAGASGAVSHLTGSSGDDDDSGLGWLWWLLGAALLAFVIWWLFFRSPDAQPTSPAVDASAAAEGAAAVPSGAVDLTAAPAEGNVTIPTGAGVTSELRDGKPVVKVYFDTGKTDVAPAFTPAAGGLKAWLDGHAGSTLAISGYNDATGNAAANAELSKNRAKAVQAALIASGIPEAAALLVKPENSTDTSVAKDAARRVEVVVK